MLNISDPIIDVRSNRVRSLMGLQSEENETNQNLANGAETTRRVPDNRRLRWEPGSKTGTNLAEEMLMNTEESVMANFDFLSRENDLDDEDEVMSSSHRHSIRAANPNPKQEKSRSGSPTPRNRYCR